MEEIKFRVYDKEEKCFHYFTLTNILQYRKEFEKHIINGDKFDLSIESKDKNEKNIFFNDFVKAPSGNIFQVIWYDEEMRIALKRKNTIYGFNVGLYELCGNPYENPEIIKEVE